MSPTTTQVSVAVLIAVAEEYWALNTGAAGTAPVLFMVTPTPSSIVVSPAPIEITVILLPTGNATELFGGIVTVTALALSEVITDLSSAKTAVYVVPIWALMA